MTPPDNQDPAVQKMPTVQAFEMKLRSVWDLALPLDRPLKDLSELDDVLKDHEQWAASVAAPGAPLTGRRACLKNQDLRGVNLARRDLRGADLSGANLEGACLEQCLLTLADLKGANLRNANLRGARLGKADLTGATLDGAELGPNSSY